MPTQPNLLLEREPISASVRDAFANYPWCTQLLSNPSCIPVQTLHQHPKPGIPSAYMASTLRGPDAITAIQSLYDPPSTKAHHSQQTLSGRLHTLYALGSGVSGHEGIAHGGFIATILDQQMGSLMIADPAVPRPRTAFCNVQYVQAVKVPSAVRVTAWKTKAEGRKNWVKAEVVGTEGVLARAEAMFLNAESNL